MTRYIFTRVCSNSEASEVQFAFVTLTDEDMEQLKRLKMAFKAAETILGVAPYDLRVSSNAAEFYEGAPPKNVRNLIERRPVFYDVPPDLGLRDSVRGTGRVEVDETGVSWSIDEKHTDVTVTTDRVVWADLGLD